MANLESLNESLTAAARILDSAAEEIRDIPLDPTREHISAIGKALSIIFDIQRQIYKIDPELERDYFKRPSLYPKELNRRFGEIVIKDADLCDMKRYQEAVALYENFLSENPPEFFVKMAKNRIAKIKRNYGV